MNDATTDAGGTPRAAKPDAILEAARHLFIRDGYGATGMDAIAREAGVAKQTVYNHFHSKEDLFAAVVRERCDEMTGILDDVDIHDGDPERVLREVGTQFLRTLFGGSRLPLLRVLVAEAARFPELGRIYYASGPDIAARRLAKYFEDLNRKNVLDVPDPRIAAEQFYGMLSGHLHVRALLDAGMSTSEAQRNAYVESAVQTLLRAWRR